ncbi:MAG: hypothetical protein H0U86_17255 [Chloroflexi bacterium]|nr:hypothetical protein [Chloroflexota bacterium]
MLGALTLDEAYRLTSGPSGYVVIIAAIAMLVGREMLRTTGQFPLRPAASIAAAVLTVSAFVIIGVRLAALAN